jgi:hypothetical protein
VPVLEVGLGEEEHDLGVLVAVELAQAVLVHLDRVHELALRQVDVAQVEPHVWHGRGRLADFDEEVLGLIELAALSEDDAQPVGGVHVGRVFEKHPPVVVHGVLQVPAGEQPQRPRR